MSQSPEAWVAERDKLLSIIACAYQIAGYHDAPEHILDVLSGPESATVEQVDAMLPYQPSALAFGPTDDTDPSNKVLRAGLIALAQYIGPVALARTLSAMWAHK